MNKRPWSFSSLTLYESCPRKYKLKYIDKIAEPTPAPDSPMVRGNRIHNIIENYLLHDGILTPEAAGLQDYCFNLKVTNPSVEEDWAYTDDWSVTEWDNDNVDCRMKLDAFVKDGVHCQIIDWKTGKDYPIKRIAQGQLYAIGASKRYPDLESFHIAFGYIDQKVLKTTDYTIKQIPKFEANYKRRVNAMRKDTKFKPINNKWNCKYCPYGPYNLNNCEWGVTE